MVLARHSGAVPVRTPALFVFDFRKLFCACGLASLCAISVFMCVIAAEPALPVSDVARAAQRALHPAAVLSEEVVPSASQVVPKPIVAEQTAPAELEFTLTRTRRPQKVGPLFVRLVRTDARRGICSVGILDSAGKLRYHRLRTNEIVRVTAVDASAELKITRVKRDRIQCTVTPLETASVAFHSTVRPTGTKVRS
jgi:hypothetical protein